MITPKPASFLDITLHRRIVAPAALPFDVTEIGTGAMCARSPAATQAVAGKLRHIVQLGQLCARLKDRIDTAGMQCLGADLIPVTDRPEQRSSHDAGSIEPVTQGRRRATRPLAVRYRLDDPFALLIGF